MYRKEINAHSPLRILEKSIHGGLGPGNLGVVMAAPGVGKTAAIVQIGLDDLMRERDLVHVAMGQNVRHVVAFYDALFAGIAQRSALADADSIRESMVRRRAIKTFAETEAFGPQGLQQAVELATRYMGLKPAAILVDGFAWPLAEKDRSGLAATITAFKAAARGLGAELWMTLTTPRGYGVGASEVLPDSTRSIADLIDVALYLEPRGGHVALRLVKDHGHTPLPDVQLELHSDTMELVAAGDRATIVTPQLPAASFTLLSGGAQGAEGEFGACAERFGLKEETYSFAGRTPERTRGLVMLSETELLQGDVSDAYLKAHMHRNYPDTPLFKSILRSIWHQVATTGELFAIGRLVEDGTASGGTGWGVELAKHWRKPVYVYDQDQKGWFTWNEERWVCTQAPRITRERFTGTGTRFLTEDGRQAIRDLFERSFKAN